MATYTEKMKQADRAAAAMPLRKYDDDEFEEDYPIMVDGKPLNVQIENQTFGSSSIKEAVFGLQNGNVGPQAIKQIELAQLLGDPRGFGLENKQAEMDLVQGIIASAHTLHSQKKCQNEVLNMKKKTKARQHLREKILANEAKAWDDEQQQKLKDKKAKRNAKRRAKAKATKAILNFTPTKEQEEDFWFWGAPPPVTQATMLKRTHEVTCRECGTNDFAENIGLWRDDGTLDEVGLCGECENP
tara:strand:+ start:529 stop:1257 length:729 start_codon:yes stop_codon:yes gene_type:complete